MRNAVILIILAVVFFAAGWTIYRFVAKRADQVRQTTSNAPSLQQAPTTTASPVVVKSSTPSPKVTSETPKTTVATVTTNTSKSNLPTTGPGSELLLAGLGLAGAGSLVVRQVSLKRALRQAYKR
jgi:hypothetical protein